MRLVCWYCGKVVSTLVPDDTIFRAIAICPECIESDEWEKANKKIQEI